MSNPGISTDQKALLATFEASNSHEAEDKLKFTPAPSASSVPYLKLAYSQAYQDQVSKILDSDIDNMKIKAVQDKLLETFTSSEVHNGLNRLYLPSTKSAEFATDSKQQSLNYKNMAIHISGISKGLKKCCFANDQTESLGDIIHDTTLSTIAGNTEAGDGFNVCLGELQSVFNSAQKLTFDADLFRTRFEEKAGAGKFKIPALRSSRHEMEYSTAVFDEIFSTEFLQQLRSTATAYLARIHTLFQEHERELAVQRKQGIPLSGEYASLIQHPQPSIQLETSE